MRSELVKTNSLKLQYLENNKQTLTYRRKQKVQLPLKTMNVFLKRKFTIKLRSVFVSFGLSSTSNKIKLLS